VTGTGRARKVAVVGGGVAGIAAAGALARDGRAVTLFEANDHLGGCCAATRVGAYTFDDGALYLAMPSMLDQVFERLGLDRPTLLPLRKVTAPQVTTLPDGTEIALAPGPEVSVRRSSRARDPDRLRADLERLIRRWEPVLRLLRDVLARHPVSKARLVAMGWRHLPKLWGTVAAELSRLIGDDALRSALSGVLLLVGRPPEKLPAQAIAGLVAMLHEGLFVPVGGMGSIPDAMARALHRHGAEIALQTAVRRIVVRDGRVRGLEADGRGFEEADVVVSTASGMLTFGSLVERDAVPRRMRRKVERAPLSHRTVNLQLGLRNVFPAPGFVHAILPPMREQYRVFEPRGDRVDWPSYVVPTLPLPELAPPGGSIIEMFIPVLSDTPVDAWDEARAARVAESAIAVLRRLGPVDIAVRRVRSPRDFRDRMHLFEGALYGLSPAAPLSAYFPHRTPIAGLCQAGQTTYPGFGVGAAALSGIFAADAVMRT
jgi:phytoene desaturase